MTKFIQFPKKTFRAEFLPEAKLLPYTKSPRKNTVNRAEPLSFPTTDTDETFMSKTTYKIVVSIVESVRAIHTAVALLDTGAGAKFKHFVLIP